MFNRNNIIKKIENYTSLPIYFPPPIVVYLHISQYTMMVLSREKYFDWLSHLFIQTCFDERHAEPFTFYLPHTIDYLSSIPLNIYRLQDEILDISRINIVEDFCRWIDNGYYIRCDVNEKNIPGTLYSSTDMLHQIFIFGYNKKDNKFISVNFDKNHDYTLLEIDFNVMEKVFEETARSGFLEKIDYTRNRENAKQFLIFLYKFNDNEVYPQQQGVLKENLLDYINGANLYEKYSFYSYNKYKYWGINTYKGISSYLDNVKDFSTLDFRIFHGLYEHKKNIYSIIEKSISKNPDHHIIQDYKDIVNKTNALRLQSLKIIVKQKGDYREMMKDYLHNLYINEKKVLDSFLETIES